MKAHWLEDESTAIDAGELREHGILYEALPLEESGYQPTLDDLRENRGYITQDQISLSPTMDNLDAICAKFKDEHLHEDDEVRFVLEGEGIFDIRSNDDRWMRVTVSAGDLIVVPHGKYHRFFLTDKKTIRCVRLFKDQSGWTPVYREAA